jgi:hypothetical protein
VQPTPAQFNGGVLSAYYSFAEFTCYSQIARSAMKWFIGFVVLRADGGFDVSSFVRRRRGRRE